jgi:hypothetical protein
MGWQQGKGIGAKESGITAPVGPGAGAAAAGQNLGLGAEAHGAVKEDDDPFEQYRKRMMLGYKYVGVVSGGAGFSYQGLLVWGFGGRGVWGGLVKGVCQTGVRRGGSSGCRAIHGAGQNLGLGAEAHGAVKEDDDPFEQYRKRMMLGYKYVC